MDYGAAFDFYKKLYISNPEFQEIIKTYMKTKQIRFFGEPEWIKIESKNFIPIVGNAPEFIDMFRLGYNEGNCVMMTRLLSYSYDDVDIVSGILPLLKGTRNAEVEGGHCWLEDKFTIIDTSLMLVIDKSLKETLGYIEEQRITASDLRKSPMYVAHKEFVRDSSLKR